MLCLQVDQNENDANEMIELNNGHTTEDGSNTQMTNQNDITASQSSP